MYVCRVSACIMLRTEVFTIPDGIFREKPVKSIFFINFINVVWTPLRITVADNVIFNNVVRVDCYILHSIRLSFEWIEFYHYSYIIIL